MGSNSNTTLHSIQDVAERADIPRSTLYLWLARGLIPEPRYDVSGTKVFTNEEVAHVVAIAKQREEAASAWRLPEIASR
jgi:DNA-binding transcriptional MerR regulator